ncbi:CarD family transcriptional regulator [Rummeliibacillus pycnus]|uniref:CarD family transcriptional regulator n=1 Tax=Rummeliibacillus pycnus TaxID=101070 RepID=UPI003D2D787D
MYSNGDLIIYSSHGICHIDEVSESTFNDHTKLYYVLHPIDKEGLIIRIPVDSAESCFMPLVNAQESKALIKQFSSKGVDWIDNNSNRVRMFENTINNGNRYDIVSLLITLLRKKSEFALLERKLSNQDNKFLEFIQHTLFAEMAVALQTTPATIEALALKEMNLSL